MDMYERIIRYWSIRAEDFSRCRVNELQSERREAWLCFFREKVGDCRDRDLLDIGTGAGFFPILMDGYCRSATGIDGSEDMLRHARANAGLFACRHTRFLCMDAQHPDFPDGSFDIATARNIVWTLPDAEAAYGEWFRLLRPGGWLLIFDADYGRRFMREPSDDPYKEITENEGSPFCPHMTKELIDERNDYCRQLAVSREERPAWDVAALRRCGFHHVQAEPHFRLDYHLDARARTQGATSGMFLITAQKA